MSFRVFKESRLSVIAAFMLVSLALAACGSSSSNSSTTASTAASTASGGGSATTATAASTAMPAATSAASPESTMTEATPMGSPEAEEGSPVSGSTTVLVRDDDKLGKILTDSKGFALYFYAKDTPGKSVCSGTCATNWPPLMASGTPTAPDGVTGTLSVITRDDGSMQVAYNGKPLYTYIKDTDQEDTYGQGIGGVWTVATP